MSPLSTVDCFSRAVALVDATVPALECADPSAEAEERGGAQRYRWMHQQADTSTSSVDRSPTVSRSFRGEANDMKHMLPDAWPLGLLLAGGIDLDEDLIDELKSRTDVHARAAALPHVRLEI